MSDRERLAKLMKDTYEPGMIMSDWTPLAEALLAKGVTLPPAPEPLVTPAMIDEVQRMEDVSSGLTCWTITLNNANALVAAAIRRAVERKTTNGVVGISAESPNGLAYGFSPSRILALFGLEAP